MFIRPLMSSIMVILLLCAGCGGGGGDASGRGTFSFKVVARAATPGLKIYAVQFKVSLPAGVTLNTLPDGTPDVSALAPAAAAGGPHTLVESNYLPGAVPPTVLVAFINSDGFPAGDIVTISGTASGGVDSSQLFLTEFKAYDQNAEEMPAVAGTISPT